MRRQPARHVAFRRLDLDDLGAEIAENLRRIRPGQELREIEHAQMRERLRARDFSCSVIAFLLLNPNLALERCGAWRTPRAAESRSAVARTSSPRCGRFLAVMRASGTVTQRLPTTFPSVPNTGAPKPTAPAIFWPYVMS